MASVPSMIVRCRGLSREFTLPGRRGGVVHAVRDLDLDMQAGEIVGFLGPNGAGKSTALRMLTTLLRPSAGEATVAGCDLVRDPAGVRRQIGYVGQGNGVSPESTVSEELVLQGRLYGLRRSEARERGRELVGDLDLDGLEKRLIKTLSGGQRRRVEVALALVHRPDLVFLDEPTSGLDPQSRANMWRHVRRLRSEQGMSVFLTTHYLDEADSLADRIIVIDDGRVVAEGTPAALKARVAGDSVAVEVARFHVPDTVEIIRGLAATWDITVEGSLVRFRTTNGSKIISELMDALGAADISALSLQVHQPTLDDVFFAITGHSLREEVGADGS